MAKQVSTIMIISLLVGTLIIQCTKKKESLTASNTPPNTPSNPSPTDGATDQPVNVDLEWTGGCVDSTDVVAYDVYLEADDTDPDSLVSENQPGTRYAPGTLSNNTRYYWKVIASDDDGNSITGPVWNFTTGSGLTPPGNLNITLTQKGAGLKFEWDPVAGANGYFVYFGTSPDSMHAIFKVVGGEFFYDDSSNVDRRGTGYYGVLAVGGDYDSIAGPMSETVRTVPYLTEDVVLYERDHSSGNSSAFGWDASGAGRILSVFNSVDMWHIYLSDGKPGESDSLELKFVSPTDAVGLDTYPPVVWDTTFIQKSAKSFAPLEISGRFAPTGGIAEEETYYLFVNNRYYAKFFIQDIFSNGVRFDAYLQTLFEYDEALRDSVGFRRF